MIFSLSKKEKWFLFGKLLIASAIMYYLFQKFESFDYSKIFTRHTLPMMALISALTLFNIVIQLMKWRNVFTDLLGVLPKRKIISSFFVGVATGSFTPGRFGEYFGRSFMINEYSGSQVITASVVDKLSNMFVLIFAGLFSTVWYLSFKSAVLSNYLDVLYAVVFLLFLLFIYLIIQRSAAAYFYKWIEKIKFMKKIFFHLQVLKKVKRKTIFLQLGFSLALYVIISLQYGILTAGFAYKPLEVSFLLVGILTLFVKSFIPSISFGDLGIRESASIFFISGIGLPAEVGFLAAISIFLFNILLPSAIGLFILLSTKR